MGGAPSRSRRLAREGAFQALYMVHVGRARPAAALEAVTERQAFAGDAEEFLQHTVEGVWENARELDQVIAGHLSAKWSIGRIAVSDLVALRIGVFELFYRPGIPPKVSITEAVELAKKYGTKESGAFVNGVLGNVLPESPKADWDPADAEVMEAWSEPEAVGMPDEPDEVLAEEGDEEDGSVGNWVIRSES